MQELDYAGLPKKRMATGALILNTNREILIVKPTYRPEWLVPGGVVEENEPPRRACCREVREELGVEIPLGRLLCVEYRSAEAGRTESLQFIFSGGILPVELIAAINLQRNELEGFQFAAYDDAMSKLAPRLARRIALAHQALREGRTIYAEDGAGRGG